ncbi:hypothetical protein A2962_03480 [Candidatus Woesebacteria bacterium RIFCSPLOWO2_01_FULL_39_61]|uniref:DUF1003 domain-containing protein n=1 Tax=Candidatus Woesebacteria bacterium RIFCSPHIGHO2_02_FULL_39_13 TaxID=1802505 RepID=A0A1F7Z3D6_9BACT|nr:MAG: hypothetical protein A2692_00610 [Candidatus Woesebacteria bacterium RIFCSPHIGHO2_01_FULL_39_95]OGM34112.1 MAG: hypothetical protein A3D01_00065 [Candidatus Woesebacteria bacterium RIFCSPHIGHO2_02_FULL_39_13]OGM38711.1 MAG: hypothetical protein A3E13_03800 [Candidatus Woesebacteria bacterium RIFCSPHIGHO2_12_FULL_40_20]OGM67572.1 MAG: hypothetical protein A2962_03480 [Candidatus Woesebacteria bacterium RIFCSPLOWO2_01_FULL_39_61]OGM74272.1 MAG: hypothetical protein A3H19_01980 [Candidatus
MKQPTHEVSKHLIKSFEAKALKKRSLAVRFADDLTSLFGSMFFLIVNALVFIVWILINTGKVQGIAPFDPFPFSMLTTVVSLEAIILTVIVLMSQNRSSLISSMREEIDIQVNLIAEREITKILKLLNELLKVKGIKLEDKELDEMLKEIDASYLERKLEDELFGKPETFVNKVNKVTKPIRMVGEEFEEGVEKVAERFEKKLTLK